MRHSSLFVDLDYAVELPPAALDWRVGAFDAFFEESDVLAGLEPDLEVLLELEGEEVSVVRNLLFLNNRNLLCPRKTNAWVRGVDVVGCRDVSHIKGLQDIVSIAGMTNLVIFDRGIGTGVIG